jgi:hypothetical protein
MEKVKGVQVDVLGTVKDGCRGFDRGIEARRMDHRRLAPDDINEQVYM